MSVMLSVENISKQYRLGLVGASTLKDDFKRWNYRIRGKEDPFLKLGDVNDRSLSSNDHYVWALRDINFEVNRGEVLGVIGKNGAGKSTLLKILSRVTSPTTGRIRSKGRIASLLEVGTGFHPELTGRENIYLNGAILGMTRSEIRKKEEEIIDFSGCGRYIDTPVKRYSSGMRVRLGFAVAAFLEPDILVVDEVLAVGDAEFQKKAIGKMQDISKGEGRTVLFVSHSMNSVSNLCTSCMVLKNGMISYMGETEAAISYYLSQDKQKFETNLLEIGNRSGSGEVKFKEFSIEDSFGNKLDSILSGQTVKFCFKLKSFIPNNKQIDLGFSIHSMRDEVMTVLYSSYQHVDLFIDQEGDHIVTCMIEDFPLNEGEYIVRGRLLSENNEIDWPKMPLGKLSIIKGDYYKTGSKGFTGVSKMLIKGIWEKG